MQTRHGTRKQRYVNSPMNTVCLLYTSGFFSKKQYAAIADKELAIKLLNERCLLYTSSRQIQTQAQQQIQTLSPQQILVVKLFELPAIELEDRVRAELLENPAMEEGNDDPSGDE